MRRRPLSDRQLENDELRREALASSPWRTVGQACGRAQVGPKTIYAEIRAGRLKAVRVGGRREYRTTDPWIDEWLEAAATTVVVDMARRRRA